MRISDWSSDVCSSDLESQETCLLRSFFVWTGCARRTRSFPRVTTIVGSFVRGYPVGEYAGASSRMRAALWIVQRGKPCALIVYYCFRPLYSPQPPPRLDRKSTRLNSSSLMRISYAVFCLKKKIE